MELGHPVKKQYPKQYPQQAVRVLRAMSFTDGKMIKIVGSASEQNQLYFADYDADEEVSLHYKTLEEALGYLTKRFKEMIRELKKIPNTYIGDIKCGVIEEWRVIPERVGQGNKAAYLNKIDVLLKDNIITLKEADLAKKIVNNSTTVQAKAELKFHIVRWTPEQVLKGSQRLRDGRLYTLEEGFASPAITKLDTITLINGRYTELSCIYSFLNNDKVINPTEMDVEKSLKEAINLYTVEGNPFKVLKRRYALAKLFNDVQRMNTLSKKLNSSLGLLYVIYSDVKTLADLMEAEHLPKQKVEDAIQAFKEKMIRVYQEEGYLKKEQGLLQDLEEVSHAPTVKKLRMVEEAIFSILSKQTELFSE
jgi:hypothetical protein